MTSDPGGVDSIEPGVTMNADGVIVSMTGDGSARVVPGMQTNARRSCSVVRDFLARTLAQP